MLLGAYAAGIVMVCLVRPWPLAGSCTVIVFLSSLWLLLSRTRWGWLPFLGMLLVAGFINASLDLHPPVRPDHISRFAESAPLNLEGLVTMVDRKPSGGYRLQVEMRRAITRQGAMLVTGDILLYVKQGNVPPGAGQLIRWRSALRRPHRFGNPGEFDYPLYLAARGIHATASVAHSDAIVILADQPGARSALLEKLRQSLAGHIGRTVPEPAAGLLQSLLLGMRGGLDDELRRVLAAGGIAHLFAISGLHFGLLALLLYQLGRWLYTRSRSLPLRCPPQRIVPVLLIMPLAAYLMLSGNAWATRRAFLTVTAVALLYAWNRRTPPMALLATVALVLLLAHPLALFQPGFQLSFCGVAGILAWLPAWQRLPVKLAGPLRWPLTLVLTTLAATLATAPATLWHFHQFAPAGLVTNLIAIPLIAWGAVPIGLASLALLPLAALAADFGLQISAWLVTMAVDAAASLSHWPGLKAVPVYLTLSHLILLVGGLLCMLPAGRYSARRLVRPGILAAAFAAAWLVQPPSADFQVLAISVGQGDATLVSLAGGRHYLIDGGGLPGSSIDPGEQLVAPLLGRLGIDRLEGVILTHNHPDHSSGLDYILRRFAVSNFYLAAEVAELPPQLREALLQGKVSVQRIDRGWSSLPGSAEQELALFVPAQEAPEMNERSIAVYAAQQGQGVLLTADLGQSGLRQLMEAGLPGPVTLLKLPHHGSRHARPELFLDQLKPSTCFVSAGHGNPYGFPHRQTIDACASRRVPLLRTDLQGMLTFRLVDGSWQAFPHKAL